MTDTATPPLRWLSATFAVGALALMTAFVGAIAAYLPGIRDPTKDGVVDLLVLAVLSLALLPAIVGLTSFRDPWTRQHLSGAWTTGRRAIAHLAGTLIGPRRSLRAVLILVAVGLATGAALRAGLSTIPLPPSIATATDPRYLIYLNTPRWQIAVHAALNAPLLEEVLFRAPLLALAATLTARRTRPAHRRLILLSASLVSAILFALIHAGAGPGNVVAALIGAVTLTVLALYTRSLIPGIAAHAMYDVFTFTL